MAESRVKKTFLNVRVNMICYFAAIIVSFFTRKIFLDQLGKDFIGLTTTINSLLGFLNLAELGVGTSIAYFLYKPLFQKDREKINELISIMGYLYRNIGLFILGAGIVFSLFLPLIFKTAPFSLPLIFYCFYASLASSLLGYFVNYRANTIFGADQRQYLVTGYFQATQLFQVILQALLALKLRSYPLYITIGLLFACINSGILNWKYKQIYPQVEADVACGKVSIKQHPEIMQYVKRVFVHQIGGFISSSVMPTVIYSFTSLGLVTLYSNYTLLTSKISALVGSMMGGSGASVGNLIAEGNMDNTYKCYKEMFSVKFLLVTVLSVIMFRCSSPFISVWLGKDYVIDTVLVALICIEFCLNLLRDTTEEFLNGFGLKADIWVPICRICSLAIMIPAGLFWGLKGILTVPVAFLFLVLHTWKPYYLYKKGFRKPIAEYIALFLRNLIPIFLAYCCTFLLLAHLHPVTDSPDSWKVFLTDSILFSIPFCILSLFYAVISSEGIRMFIKRIITHHNYH